MLIGDRMSSHGLEVECGVLYDVYCTCISSEFRYAIQSTLTYLLTGYSNTVTEKEAVCL